MCKIFLYRYTALNGDDVAARIENIMRDGNVPLTPEQVSALYRGLGYGGIIGKSDKPFQAYEWEKPHKEGKNIFWRFSSLFLLLIGFLSQLFLPIWWLFTGKWGYHMEDSAFSKLIVKWYQKAFE